MTNVEKLIDILNTYLSGYDKVCKNIPDLVTEIERLQEENKEMRQALERVSNRPLVVDYQVFAREVLDKLDKVRIKR